jgi:hypothetical protein
MRVFLGGVGNEPPRLFRFLSIGDFVSPFFYLEIIMNKTTQPAITLTTLDAQALLDAIVRLENRSNGKIELEAGHYRTITQLCVALEAPQFYTEHFARKAATTTKEIQS